MRLLPAVLAFAVLAPAAAFAGPASDAVKRFYPPTISESDPSIRDRFVDPAKTKLDQDDKLIAVNDVGCLGFLLAVDAQDFDDAEVARILKLDEKVSGDDAEVVASFRMFTNDADAPDRKIKWTLKKVGSDWKVADIESPENNWKLSEFDCTEGAGAE